MSELLKIEDVVKKLNTDYYLDELIEASERIAVLNSKVADCKLKDYIYLPFLKNKEAVESLQIEGTETSMSEVLDESSQPEENSNVMKIQNYSEALNMGCNAVRFGFDEALIKAVHKTMMASCDPTGVLGIGEYKKVNNYISRNKEVLYMPPLPDEIPAYMKELVKFANEDTELNVLVRAAILHSQFESIHPFTDGNGRTGRILVPIYLYYKRKITTPLFYISEAFNKNKISYYQMLTESRKGDINNWVKFFLEKCIAQANSHIDYVSRINELYDETTKQIEKLVNTSSVNSIVEVLFKYPKLNSKLLAGELQTSTSQAIRYLNTLSSNGILWLPEHTSQRRNKSYYFIRLINLFMD